MKSFIVDILPALKDGEDVNGTAGRICKAQPVVYATCGATEIVVTRLPVLTVASGGRDYRRVFG